MYKKCNSINNILPGNVRAPLVCVCVVYIVYPPSNVCVYKWSNIYV